MDFVFNIAKGRVPHYASLPGADDSLVVVPILAAGVEADATLKDYVDLGTLLAASNNESTQLGRKEITAPAIETIDNTNDRLSLGLPEAVTLTATAVGDDISAVLICYKPTADAIDSAIVPLTKHDYEAQVGIGSITVEISPDGFFRAED